MTAVQCKEKSAELTNCQVHSFSVESDYLDRSVLVDVYLPVKLQPLQALSLLLVNDGQDLPRMPFAPLFDELLSKGQIKPMVVVSMHCNEDRRLEYGTADILDFMNRGSRAKYHRKFVVKELIPFIGRALNLPAFNDIGFAGFSLGGLSAMDIAWKYPEIFSTVGVFSGSLWWRLRDLNDGYVEETDRIMHKLVREGKFAPNQRFFFETGTQDEKMDRNHNGIIDSIDDTLDLIKELEAKGYQNNGQDILYLELADGRHDVATWARAFPDFLKWGWGVSDVQQ